MVTAILIPIICFYFYWLSKKEIKENEQKWLNLNEIVEEAILNGKIIQIDEYKKRFYYHRYIRVIDIKLQTETKILNVKRITPYIKPIESVPLRTGDNVKLYGNWKENEFHFLRFEPIKIKEH
ncbi:hypothetical protein [Pseudoneobacillus sp. C159]